MEKETIHFNKGNLPLHFRHLTMDEKGNHRGMHAHTAIEIVEVRSGQLQCYVDDEIVTVNPGRILFINSNIGHRLVSQNAEIIYLQMDVGLLEENSGDPIPSMLHRFMSHTHAKPYMLLSDDRALSALIDKIDVHYHENSKQSPWYVKAGLYELIAFMYAADFILPLKLPKEPLGKLEQIVAYIDANYRSAITLDDIAASANYNKYTVCHLFKELTGATVFEYVNFLRVHYAVEKLRERGRSVSQIAALCGYSSDTYFNRVFKSFFGCSPSVYRRQMTEN